MTGRPGFKQSLSTTQIWQVSILLSDADKLPKAVRDRLTNNKAEEVGRN